MPLAEESTGPLELVRGRRVEREEVVVAGDHTPDL
jgi:hypothetical protein